MNDLVPILKMVSYLLVVPIVLAIPLVIFGKISNRWLESSIEKKNKMSLYICLSIIIFCFAHIFFDIDNYTKRSFLAGIIFLVTGLHFSTVVIRNQGGYKKKTLSGRKYEAFNAGIKGAWQAKYHWGTIVQILSITDFIFVQIK